MRLIRFKRITLQAADSLSAGTHAHLALARYKLKKSFANDINTICKAFLLVSPLVVTRIFVLHTCCIPFEIQHI